ncbi:CaiB/BaiF CoA transferase family protein [Bordetella muralis]|uniref:CaiB/BaiF CoA transferase family protein n=1 Tax=Bordetella muralis TaxID=1649130 RepID=UPI0039F0F26B
MPALLSNIKVLDLSRVLAGPWASQILADLGADVIKVERPGRGDDTRSWGPPFLKNGAGEDTSDGAYFIATNRGKRSMTLDLQTPEGQELVKTLCRDADVVLENYKVGTLARLGLDYAALSAINPRLIYCSVTGFGQTGPRAAEPAYDFLIQAMGGLMSVTGERDDKPGGGPQKVGVPIVDLSTGVYAALGIVAALLRRTQTGQGEYVDVSMLDVQVGLLANQAMNFLLGNRIPKRTGTAHPNIQPQRTFSCADGDIIIVVGNDAQFVALCDVIEQPELAQDARYATNSQRVKNLESLDPILDAVFASQPRAYWLDKLKQAGVPAGSINNVAEVFDDPQVQHRAMLRHLPHPVAGSVPQVMNPLRFGHSDLRVDRAPPLLGEHTEDILNELGMSAERIQDLRARKII